MEREQFSSLSSCYLLHAGILFGLYFDHEGGGGMPLQNIGWLSTNSTAIYHRTLHNHRCKNIKFCNWKMLCFRFNLSQRNMFLCALVFLILPNLLTLLYAFLLKFHTLTLSCAIFSPTSNISSSLDTMVHTGCGVHPTSYTRGTGGSFPGVKRPGREADHSPPTSAKVKKMCIYTTPPYTFMV
jgi:hypothetical protein